MPDTPYSKISNEQLILRDQLAIDRTVLANERTFLAYVRTALTCLITGVGLIKFFDSLFIDGLGWVFVVAAGVTIFVGTIRFNHVRKPLAALRGSTPTKII